MTDDEILQETIRRINRLISQGELYEAFWLARIWDILDLWDWRETLEDAEALVNQLISEGKLRRAYELAQWWGIQGRWRWDEIFPEISELRNQEEDRTDLVEQ